MEDKPDINSLITQITAGSPAPAAAPFGSAEEAAAPPTPEAPPPPRGLPPAITGAPSAINTLVDQIAAPAPATPPVPTPATNVSEGQGNPPPAINDLISQITRSQGAPPSPLPKIGEGLDTDIAYTIGKTGKALVEPTLNLLHGGATLVDKALGVPIRAITGAKEAPNILRLVTGAAKAMGAPPEFNASPDDPWYMKGTEFVAQVVGGIAPYMLGGAALKGMGLAIPAAAETAGPVAKILSVLGNNALTFGTTDVLSSVGQGGGWKEAQDAFLKSIPTAALFTVAQVIPFNLLTKNPWIQKGLESTATGTAFVGSHIVGGGETDPGALAVSFLTGFGLHAVTSGFAARGDKKAMDAFYDQYKIDWKETNKISDAKMAEVQAIVDKVPPGGAAPAAPPAEPPVGGPFNRTGLDALMGIRPTLEPGPEAAPTAPVEPGPETPPPAPPVAEVPPEVAAAPPSPVIPPPVPEATGFEVTKTRKGWSALGLNFEDEATARDFAAKAAAADAAGAPPPDTKPVIRPDAPMGATQDNVAPEPKAPPSKVIPGVKDVPVEAKTVPAGAETVPTEAKTVPKTPAPPLTVAGDASTPVPEVPKPVRDTFKEAVDLGVRTTAQTADGQKIPIQYAIVPQESLIVSHDTTLNENPAFPQEFQPRDRTRKASIERLGNLENNYNPEFYGATPAAWDGAPIVGPDMVVESGNGRLLLNRRGVEGATPKQRENQAAYQDWLQKNVEALGIDLAKLEGVKDPILVRIRTNEIDDTARKKLVRDMNISGVETSSEMENAVADGKVLREGDVLNLFNPDMALNAAGNRDFRTSFINGLNPMDRSRYVSPNGDINVSGLKRIRDAVFAAAYGEGSALSKMAEETDNASKNVTTALMAVAPRLAKINQEIARGNLYDLSFSKNLADAASILTWIKENQGSVPAGMTPVDYYLSQGQLFDKPATLTVEIVKVLENYKNSAKKLGLIFNHYMDTIERVGNPRQPDLLGSALDLDTFGDPLKAAVNDIEALYGKGKVASDVTPTPATRPGNPPDAGLPPGTVRVAPGVLSASDKIIPGDSITMAGEVGTVLELKGDQVRVRMEGMDPKGSAWVPLDVVEMNKAYDSLAQYQKQVGEKIGEIKGKLDLNQEGVFETMGKEAYASSVSNISVKELMQNAFDAVKEYIYKNKGAKVGNIHLNIDRNERSITIKDDGMGMTEDIVNKGLFTIGGTVKDMPAHLRSGGLGMAKMAIFTCADRVVLETTRDGRTIKLDALSKDIRASNFTPEIFKAEPGAHGTTIKVFIPREYTNSTGEVIPIPFPSYLAEIRPLKYPLLGPVAITADVTAGGVRVGEVETLAKGLNHDVKATPKITTATFSWGTADIYYGKERIAGYPSHSILSSGIFQFENTFKDKPGGGGDTIPYNIIVDIKSNVAAQHGDYPFAMNRESFKPRMAKEINELRKFLHAIARGTEAEDIQANFKNIKSMPRINFDQRSAGEGKEARAALKAGPIKATKAPPIPKTITITENGAKTANGAFFSQADENVKTASAKFDTKVPTMDQFMLDMDQPPDKPVFHNNTNLSLAADSKLKGHPELFFAEIGTIITEMKEKLAESGRYDRLGGLVYSGVSIDKGYCGVAISLPYKAAFINPLNPIYKSNSVMATREGMYMTMVHELAHVVNMVDHGEVHNNNMSQIQGWLSEKGLTEYFQNLILKSLTAHSGVVQELRNRYDERTTRNTGKSLKTGQTQQPQSGGPVGVGESGGGNELRTLQAGGGPGGGGPVPAGVETGEPSPERSRTGGILVGARPLSKFEQRLKGITSAYPDADPERVAQALRAAPKMADREIAAQAGMAPEAAGKVQQGTTQAAMAKAGIRGAVQVQAGLFGEPTPGGPGGLFAEPGATPGPERSFAPPVPAGARPAEAAPTERWQGNQLEWSVPKREGGLKTPEARARNWQDMKGTVKTGEIDDSLPLTDKALTNWKDKKEELGFANMKGLAEEDVRSILSAVRRGEASVSVNRMGKMAFYKLKSETAPAVTPAKTEIAPSAGLGEAAPEVQAQPVSAGVPSGVAEFMGKYGTSRGAGKPEGLLTGKPEEAPVQTREQKITEHEEIHGQTKIDGVTYSKFTDLVKAKDWEATQKELTLSSANFTRDAFDHHFNPQNLMARLVDAGMELREAQALTKEYGDQAFRPVAEKMGGVAPGAGKAANVQAQFTEFLKEKGLTFDESKSLPPEEKSALKAEFGEWQKANTATKGEIPTAITGAPPAVEKPEVAASSPLEAPENRLSVKPEANPENLPVTKKGDRKGNTIGFDAEGREIEIKWKAKTQNAIEHWVVEIDGLRYGRYSDEKVARDYAATKIDYDQTLKNGGDVKNIFAPPDEFAHLKTSPDETTAKVGDRTLTQEALFSKPPAEGQDMVMARRSWNNLRYTLKDNGITGFKVIDDGFGRTVKISAPPDIMAQVTALAKEGNHSFDMWKPAQPAEENFIMRQTPPEEAPPVVAETQQGQLIPGEPKSFKEFEADLAKDDYARERELRDPANKLIPLYEGETFLGPRGGDFIKDAKGKTVKLTNADIYERLYDPKTTTLPLGTETTKPEKLLGTPGEKSPTGTIEEPPGFGGSVLRAFRNEFAAATNSEKARMTKQAITAQTGWARREMAKAMEILDKHFDRFAAMNQEDLRNFTDTVEKNDLPTLRGMADNGQFEPGLLQAAEEWRRLADGVHLLRANLAEQAAEDAKKSGKPAAEVQTAYWEQYFPRMFEQPPEGAGIHINNYMKGKSLTGPEGFKNARSQLLFSDSIKPKLDTIRNEDGTFSVQKTDLYKGTKEIVETFPDKAAADAMVAEKGGIGLKPLDPNYINMMKANLFEQFRFVAGKYIQNDLIAGELISRKPEPGHIGFEGDKTLEGYFAHPDVVQVMNNFLSKGIADNILYKIYNTPTSLVNGFLVGFSAFHVTFSSITSMAMGIGQNVGRAIGAAATGNFGVAGHYLSETAKALNLPAQFMLGGKGAEVYKNPDSPFRKTLVGEFELGKLIDGLTLGGMENQVTPFKQMLRKLIEPKQAELTQMSRSFSESLTDNLGWPRKIAEAVAWPTMGQVVGRLKLAGMLRTLSMEMSDAKRAGTLADFDITRASQEIGKKYDNTMGQMVQDNLSMKQIHKNILRLWIGFPGWNIGSFTDILQLGKGAYHTAKNVVGGATDIAMGRKPTWDKMSRSERMSMEFYGGTVLVMAVFGALAQKLFTGEWPDDKNGMVAFAKDVMMPQTGELMSNGQPERLRLPTYMRDILSLNHPVEMAKHKANWPIRMFTAMVDNQDFFGTQIRDPYASVGTQIGQEAKYVGKSLLPFGVQGYLATEAPKARALNLIGITKVPRLYSNTDAMNVIDDYNKQNRATMTSIEAEAEKSLKGDLRKLAKAQDEDGFKEAAKTAMEAGTLTRQQVKTIVDESQAPPGLGRFVALPVEWQVRAWAKATDAEKEAWQPYFIKKVMSAKPEILIRNRDILDPTLREMGLDDAADAIQNLKISDKAGAFKLAGLGVRQPAGEMGDIDTVDLAMAHQIAAQEAKLGTEKKAKAKKASKYAFLGIQ